MAKFWPLHHYNQCMGENRRKTLSTTRGGGACQPLPRDMQSGAKCISPILSHTLTVVVQWPKFGHSTTLNNKGYKPHREMRHVS